MNARKTKIKRDDTITALHEFDGNQTNALGTIERDLNTMETWLSDIEGLFKSGLTDVNFPVEQWALISSQNNLWTDLAYRTMPLGMRNTPSSIESTTPFPYSFPFDDGNLMTVEPAINACAVPTPAPENTGAEIAKGVGTGLYDAGKDFVTGIWDFIVNPIESFKSVVYAVSHPVETYTYLETAITDSYERDVINGDAYSRSRWFSYAAGMVATSIVGTKGAGALTKTSVATTTSVVQNKKCEISMLGGDILKEELNFGTLKYFLECYFNVSANYNELDEILDDLNLNENAKYRKVLKEELQLILQVENWGIVQVVIKKYGMRKMNEGKVKRFIHCVYESLDIS